MCPRCDLNDNMSNNDETLFLLLNLMDSEYLLSRYF